MVLTPDQIYGLRVRSGMDAFRPMKEHWQAKDDDAAYRFARAIEAEVRKQDTELIRQMLEALEGVVTQVKYYEPVTAAIAAARARLEEKPCAYRTTQL
jgi:hypothetical protein